jgi:hypothetical protein
MVVPAVIYTYGSETRIQTTEMKLFLEVVRYTNAEHKFNAESRKI